MADQTFQTFTPEQAQSYLSTRGVPFPDQLFEIILKYHHDHPNPPPAGQQNHHVVDFGCGPGIATMDMLRFWDRVTGVDPGEAMIGVARKALELPKYDSVRDRIEFVLSPSEQVESNGTFARESVDVICAAQAVCQNLSLSYHGSTSTGIF
jgi:2-polyprenyl-3-methyl-5-hydroxy-6-metoxy-1,4-benzoquinol methylase